ncbi:hypothetical protein J3R03_002639 [Actinoplanes couchii]|uniref:Uncharacterized protein n=1 Tax=Actinoplanes couchii TaxID=403638 RepID=A0ABQ3XS18_9ACTN|nr:hypothetical protein [Actinoplanes couchii]GID61200.1 hypothetical protein Aco03nite_096040 [Actinoplanes couchii]
MWHDMLEWLPTVTAIVRLIAAVINLSRSAHQLRARVSVPRREARHSGQPKARGTARRMRPDSGWRNTFGGKRGKNRHLQRHGKSGA